VLSSATSSGGSGHVEEHVGGNLFAQRPPSTNTLKLRAV
jgi:hypothetical protein